MRARASISSFELVKRAASRAGNEARRRASVDSDVLLSIRPRRDLLRAELAGAPCRPFDRACTSSTSKTCGRGEYSSSPALCGAHSLSARRCGSSSPCSPWRCSLALKKSCNSQFPPIESYPPSHPLPHLFPPFSLPTTHPFSQAQPFLPLPADPWLPPMARKLSMAQPRATLLLLDLRSR